ncbi:hypothetical protein E1A91_A12G180500v1 [Gossypium mustelinum]|uniref:Uncharacterized protein n=3 Tax=Gossypium TaxID=3633 RepID=A0A5J5TCK9_GOSBA|nr:hypothetical protein ES319_A12G176300v1 [Gossypium barbadense]TYG90569.1 hypothetical protein ES288_A12G192000v1 [Gossypium darwinii]TYJ05687.1 hypothetical protein E1A91_A12G180500v1 [Gossypium mustelinum]
MASSAPNAPPLRRGSRLENKGNKMHPLVRIHVGERAPDGRNRRYGGGHGALRWYGHVDVEMRTRAAARLLQRKRVT